MYVCVCCFCVRFSFSSTSQEIGWEEHLRNDIFCVKCDAEPEFNQLEKLWAPVITITLLPLMRLSPAVV